jgi:phage tail-like protein
MTNPSLETVPNYPFSAFKFAVEIEVEGLSNRLCNAAFAECDGLEMSMEVKTLREGGNNAQQIRLAGPLTFGNLTLKRGMTANFDLWDWFTKIHEPGGARLRAKRSEIVIFSPDGQSERARFILKRCLPIKLKAPALNAKDGVIAIEEMQLAYESMTLKSAT